MSDLPAHISDDSDLRKFRTEIPNLIDDLGLNPYQRTLYTHYKRVCGANGGRCVEGTRTTATKTSMSMGQVSTGRIELAELGLINRIEQGQYIHIQIIDIWELNFAFYSIKKRPDIAGWTIAELADYIKSVHTVNSYYVECSPDEQSVHTVNAVSEKRSPGETKKEHNKKEPIKKEHIQIPAFKVYFDITGKYGVPDYWRKQMGKIVGTNPGNLEFWGEIVAAYIGCGWAGSNVKLMLEYFQRREVPGTYQNGATNGHKSIKRSETIQTTEERERYRRMQAALTAAANESG